MKNFKVVVRDVDDVRICTFKNGDVNISAIYKNDVNISGIIK